MYSRWSRPTKKDFYVFLQHCRKRTIHKCQIHTCLFCKMVKFILSLLSNFGFLSHDFSQTYVFIIFCVNCSSPRERELSGVWHYCIFRWSVVVWAPLLETRGPPSCSLQKWQSLNFSPLAARTANLLPAKMNSQLLRNKPLFQRSK